MRCLILSVVLFCSLVLQAQEVEKVALSYENQRLESVLEHLSREHGLRFSYSAQLLPLDKPVSFEITDVSIEDAMRALFANNDIKAALIDGQYVLKHESKDVLDQVPKAAAPNEGSIPATEDLNFQPALNRRVLERVPMQREPIVWRDEIESEDLQQYQRTLGVERPVLQQYGHKTEAQLVLEDLRDRFEDNVPNQLPAQISVLPHMSIRGDSSDINNLSVNLLWGKNTGVEGFEAGVLFNSITEDVTGVQIAGLGSTVEGEVQGLQASGLFCATGGDMTGLQAAGMFNTADNVEMVQAAGFANVAKGNVTGLQAAGIANVAAGASEGGQVAGAVNVSKLVTGVQASGIANYAGDVSGVQIASVLNVARKVKGSQIGLINVSESVEGASFGLLNFVRNGYNHVEVFTQDQLQMNVNIKFGSRGFHNILEVGRDIKGEYLGLGYGVGTTVKMTNRIDMGAELVAKQITEDDRWFEEVNVVGQLRLTASFRCAKHLSIFAGPMLNMMLSERIDPETGIYGSGLAHDVILSHFEDGTSTKAWYGFTTGLRF